MPLFPFNWQGQWLNVRASLVEIMPFDDISSRIFFDGIKDEQLPLEAVEKVFFHILRAAQIAPAGRRFQQPVSLFEYDPTLAKRAADLRSAAQANASWHALGFQM